MENIERVKLLVTLKTKGKLYEEGTELTRPFPRIIQEEYRKNRGTLEVLELIPEGNENPPPTSEEEIPSENKPEEVETLEEKEKPKKTKLIMV
jgi:hypothetical protein